MFASLRVLERPLVVHQQSTNVSDEGSTEEASLENKDNIVIADEIVSESEAESLYQEDLGSPLSVPPSSTRTSPLNSTLSGETILEDKLYHCKPCSKDYIRFSSVLRHKRNNPYHEHKVAEYEHVNGPIEKEAEEVRQPTKKTTKHYCKDCDYATQSSSYWTRHLKCEKHMNNVSGNTKRQRGVVKEVKTLSKKRMPQRYCEDCDQLCSSENWNRHLRSHRHMYNVTRNMQHRGHVEDMGTSEELTEMNEMDKAYSEKKPGHFCKDCSKFYLTQNWKCHLGGRMHRINVAKTRQRNKLTCQQNLIVKTEVVQLKILSEELPERYCKDCDIYPGVRWARHLASPSHVFNAMRLSQRKESITEDDSITDDEPMTGMEEAVEVSSAEHAHYCEDCDGTYAGVEWERHLISEEHVDDVERSMKRDEDMLCDEDAAASSPATQAPPPITPECYVDETKSTPSPASASRRQEWYCDVCDANLIVEGTWTTGEHMARHEQEMYKRFEVRKEPWRRQLEEDAAQVGG
jgi:hypothetical protein